MKDVTFLLYTGKNNVDSLHNIEIDNNERGDIGDFTTISDIRITKSEPE